MKKTQEFVSFTFDEFRLLNVSFSVNVDFDFENDVKINPHISRKSEYDEKKRILISYVKVSLTGDEAPFAFTVEGAGQLVHGRQEHAVQLGVQRAVAAAVEVPVAVDLLRPEHPDRALAVHRHAGPPYVQAGTGHLHRRR